MAAASRLSHDLRGGDADTAQWPSLLTDRTLVFELSGAFAAGPGLGGNPDLGPQAVPALSWGSLLSLAGLLLAGGSGRRARSDIRK